MRIQFSPVRLNAPITLEKRDDTLIINGQRFDFSPIPDGATLPQAAINSDHFAGPVERIDGMLHLTLRLPHGANAPEETRFPQPITVTTDGPIDLPSYDTEETDAD